MEEIKPCYLHDQQTEAMLKISNSTIKRLLKWYTAGKQVGKQYRILGKEVLRLISRNCKKTIPLKLK